MKKIMLLIAVTVLSFSGSVAQNIGIGTSTPATPLHIKSTAGQVLRIEGTNPYISFFNGPVYSGYLWYNSDKMELGTPAGSGEPVLIAPGRVNTAYFTTAGNVGIGTASPTEKLQVNGNMNLTGLLKLNGSSGTTGQVLTSNGTADPQWEDMAYGNDIRFAFMFQQNATLEDGDIDITTLRYNLSPTNITIGDEDITLQQSGLYHFEIAVNFRVNYTTAPTNTPYSHLRLSPGGGLFYTLTGNKIMTPLTTAGTTWVSGEKITFEIWLNGPIVLSFWHGITAPEASSTRIIDGYVIGHLIKE